MDAKILTQEMFTVEIDGILPPKAALNSSDVAQFLEDTGQQGWRYKIIQAFGQGAAEINLGDASLYNNEYGGHFIRLQKPKLRIDQISDAEVRIHTPHSKGDVTVYVLSKWFNFTPALLFYADEILRKKPNRKDVREVYSVAKWLRGRGYQIGAPNTDPITTWSDVRQAYDKATRFFDKA